MTYTLYFPYYNQPEPLERQLEWYNEMPVDLKFFIVDDGSQDHPLDVSLFKGFSHPVEAWRIDKDVPWNQPECNNLAFRYISTDKVLRTDIDHFYDEPTLSFLSTFQQGKRTLLMFTKRYALEGGARTPNYHPNSYLIYRDAYWTTGGYNEYFSGNYGSDDTEWMERTGLATLSHPLAFNFASKACETKKLNRDTAPNHRKLHEKDRPFFTFQNENSYQKLC